LPVQAAKEESKVVPAITWPLRIKGLRSSRGNFPLFAVGNSEKVRKKLRSTVQLFAHLAGGFDWQGLRGFDRGFITDNCATFCAVQPIR
jgi:hypothetical protein